MHDFSSYFKFIPKDMYEKKAFVDFLKFLMLGFPVLFCFVKQNMLKKCLMNLFETN